MLDFETRSFVYLLFCICIILVSFRLRLRREHNWRECAHTEEDIYVCV